MSKFDDDRGRPDPRLQFPQVGKVVNRVDPLGHGRIQASVPGLLEPFSAWAWPLGHGKGKDLGGYSVPQVDAVVVLWFINGEREKVMYMAGWFTRDEGSEEEGGGLQVPVEARVNPPDNHVWATPGFRVELDETEGARRAALTVVKTGDRLEFDEESNTITLKATTNLVLEADGQVTINGLVVVINGRTVRPVDENI